MLSGLCCVQAPVLVQSMAFRLGTGSLTFALLSVLIVAFILARCALCAHLAQRTVLQ